MKPRRNISLILFSAVTTTWIQHLIQAVCGLVVLPLLVYHLGKTEYGIWVLVVQTISFLTMTDLGVTSSMGRLVARYRVNGDQQLKQLYSTIFVMMVCVGALVSILTLALSPWIPNLLGISSYYYDVTIVTFIVSGLSLAMQFPLNIGIGILTGHQLYGLQGIGKISVSILNLLGALFLLYINSITLVNVAIMYGANSILAQILLAFVSWKMTKPWSLRLRFFSQPLAREVFSLGGSSLVVTLSSLCYRSGLGIAVGRILGPETAGIYGVALTLISHIQPLITAFSTPFTTLASEWEARNRIMQLRKIVMVVILTTCALSTSVAAGLFIYGESILRLLLSHDKWTALDFRHAWISLSIMGIGLSVGLPQVVSQSILRGVGKHWQVSYAFLGISILSLLSGVAAMDIGYGIYGAAMGWSFYWILQGIVFYPQMISKFLKLPILKMVVNAYLPGIGIGLVVLALAWFLKNILDASILLNLLIEIGICAIVSCAAIMVFGGYSDFVRSRLSNWLT